MERISKDILEQIVPWGPPIAVAVIVFLAFWILAKIAKKTIIKTGERSKLDGHIVTLLAKSVKLCLMSFGVITSLGTLGINVSALVAGLGLTGFALGFALKDTISNTLAGVLILIYRPFDIKLMIESKYLGMKAL